MFEQPTWSMEQAAAVWGITLRVARRYCALGRVPGAFLYRGRWEIPVGAPKPEDLRGKHWKQRRGTRA